MQKQMFLQFYRVRAFAESVRMPREVTPLCTQLRRSNAPQLSGKILKPSWLLSLCLMKQTRVYQ